MAEASKCQAKDPVASTGVYSDSERPQLLFKAACQCWKSGLYTDVTVLVGDRRFEAHRLVLASLSDFFPPLMKFDEKGCGEVSLHSISPEDFSVLLNFAYTGEVNPTQGNVQSLLVAADYLSVGFVKKVCETFMAGKLEVDNVCDVLNFSYAYSLSILRTAAEEYLKRHLEEVSTTDAYLELDPDVLIRFFQDDNLVLYDKFVLKRTEREKLIFVAVLRYLSSKKFVQDARVIEDLMRTVRLTELPKVVVKKCLKEFKKLEKNNIVEKYVGLQERANRYIRSLKQNHSLTEPAGEGAEVIPIPDSWFRHRKLASFTINQGRRYASGGQVARFDRDPEHLCNDPSFEISEIDIWIRSWDGRDVIGALALRYRQSFSVATNLEYVRCRVEPGWQHHRVELGPQEVVVKMIIGSGYLIDRLTFYTNIGRILGPYGGPGGGETVEHAPEGGLSYLYDINCDCAESQGEDAILNLIFRWITLE